MAALLLFPFLFRGAGRQDPLIAAALLGEGAADAAAVPVAVGGVEDLHFIREVPSALGLRGVGRLGFHYKEPRPQARDREAPVFCPDSGKTGKIVQADNARLPQNFPAEAYFFQSCCNYTCSCGPFRLK